MHRAGFLHILFTYLFSLWQFHCLKTAFLVGPSVKLTELWMNSKDIALLLVQNTGNERLDYTAPENFLRLINLLVSRFLCHLFLQLLSYRKCFLKFSVSYSHTPVISEVSKESIQLISFFTDSFWVRKHLSVVAESSCQTHSSKLTPKMICKYFQHSKI